MSTGRKTAGKPAHTSKPKSVKMRRADGKTADVHPDMVEDFRKGGYRET